MNKYIRTKEDKIIKIDEKGCIKEFDMFGKKTLFAFRDKNYSYRFENGKEIIKQADTIDELCDEFIIVNTKTNHHRIWLYSNDDLRSHYFYNKNTKEVYGAIWTSKGLIYVAKMNEKGDLELL